MDQNNDVSPPLYPEIKCIDKRLRQLFPSLPSQLYLRNKVEIEIGEYMVSPKADGERALLHFTSNAFYLLRKSIPCTNIMGTFDTEVLFHNSCFYDFILDVEVVTLSCGTIIILLFDVIKVLLISIEERNFLERRTFLDKLMPAIKISNLFLKPIATCRQAESMWELWQHLPYPISGLIFICVPRDIWRYPLIMSMEWKPKSKIILDVALGEAFEKKDNMSHFLAHLNLDHDFNKEYISSANGILLGTKHMPILMRDNTYALNGLLLGSDDSFLNPNYDPKVKATHALSLWVPNEFARKSTYGIVEVEITCREKSSLELRFRQTRGDKRGATTFDDANNIIDQYLHPISLSDINFNFDYKDGKVLKSMQKKAHSLPAYRHNIDVCRLHYDIREWLYYKFGGQSIVVAHSIHDITSWNRVGFTSVLAIENGYYHQEGSVSPQHICKNNSESFPKVHVVKEDLLKKIDLSSIDILSQPVDSIFCDLGLQHLWNPKEEKCTCTFLNNLLPYLSEEGKVVVTFLDGDKILEKGSSEIFDDNNILKMEIKILNEHEIDVYIAPLGMHHKENIVTKKRLVTIFKNSGLELLSVLPFELFAESNSIELTKGDMEMSSTYVAAIFQKYSITASCKKKENKIENEALISNKLAHELEINILKFMSIPDLLKCRLLSNSWCDVIDNFDADDVVQAAYFGDLDGLRPSVVKFLRNDEKSLRSLALYKKMGGPFYSDYDLDDFYGWDYYSDYNSYSDDYDHGFYIDDDDFDIGM